MWNDDADFDEDDNVIFINEILIWRQEHEFGINMWNKYLIEMERCITVIWTSYVTMKILCHLWLALPSSVGKSGGELN